MFLKKKQTKKKKIQLSILIGSPRVYLSHNWARSRGCPITAVKFEIFCNWIPVSGHLCQLHVNNVHSNGFFPVVSLLFAKLVEYSTDFFH